MMDTAKRRGIQAFTLVELMLVVVLIALLTAVGIPSFRSLYEKSELQQVASTLAATMRYAQERAIMERIPIRLVIDVENNLYYVPVKQDEERRHYRSRSRSRSRRPQNLRNNRRRERFQKVVEERLNQNCMFEFVYKVGEDRQYRRGECEITFYPDGSCESVFVTILRLARKRDDERRMFMKTSSATGFVRMMEGQNSREGSAFYEGRYDER
jgi:type II secretion system protein H